MASDGKRRSGHPAWTGRVEVDNFPKDADFESIEAALERLAPALSRPTVVSRGLGGSVTVRYPSDEDASRALVILQGADMMGATMDARWASAATYSFEHDGSLRHSEMASFRAAFIAPMRMHGGTLEVLLAIELARTPAAWEKAQGVAGPALAFLGGTRAAGEKPLATACREMHEKTSAVMGPGGDARLHAAVATALARGRGARDPSAAAGLWVSQTDSVVYLTRMGNLPAASSNGARRLAETIEGGRVADAAAPADFVSAAAMTPPDDVARLEAAVCASRGSALSGFGHGRALRWVDVGELLRLVPEAEARCVLEEAPGRLGKVSVPTKTGDKHRVGHDLALVLVQRPVRELLLAWCEQAKAEAGERGWRLGRGTCGGCGGEPSGCLVA